MVIGLDASQPGPNINEFAHPKDNNTLRTMIMTIYKKSNATLKQLWILIQQQKEINTQFALFLQTLPIQKPSTMQPSQPLDVH